MLHQRPPVAFFPYFREALLFVLVATAVLVFSPPRHVFAAASPDLDDSFLDSPSVAGSAYSQEALLTLFYDGSTNGELHPCPT